MHWTVPGHPSGLNLPRLTNGQFKSMEDMIKNSDLPVLVDFYATWCGPCVMMSRELATLSTDPDVKDKYVAMPPAHDGPV